MGPLSRLVGKPPISPWVSADFLPLTQVVNNTNSAIPLTEIFDRVFSDVCNSLGFEVQKQKKRGSGNNRVYRNLKQPSLIIHTSRDLLQQSVLVDYCCFHLASGASTALLGSYIGHRNKRRLLSTLREEFVEKKYQVFDILGLLLILSQVNPSSPVERV